MIFCIVSAIKLVEDNNMSNFNNNETELVDTNDAQDSENNASNDSNIPLANRQAVRKAKSYLRIIPFSKQGLIEQLKFEGFSEEEATYGVNNIEVNWNEQAVLKAKTYLNLMAFSRQELINQLEFEGFTEEEAIYGVTQVGF